MKKGNAYTYPVGRGLYINLTNRCTNRCDFCIRNNGDGVYGSDPLWLAHLSNCMPLATSESMLR